MSSKKQVQRSNAELPPNTVFVDPASFAVLGQDGAFRTGGINPPFFNPTNTIAPFFQAFDQDFLTILGDAPSIREIASTESYGFAHEAPIWCPETGEIFFASNAGGDGISGPDHNNAVNKMNIADIRAALEATPSGPVNVEFTPIVMTDDVQMTNGGTGPVNGQLLFVNEGRGHRPANIVLVDPVTPTNVTVLLDNFYGRQFLSLNDVKVHPITGHIFFTDVPYGFYQNFRPIPASPSQVYRFDIGTRAVRVVADGFSKVNGIAFTSDGNTVYVTDSGAQSAFYGTDGKLPTTIYTYDVDSDTNAFVNRRVFAYADAGIPDGLQVDTNGNVYAGCGDGVHAWNSKGKLLGKFVTGNLTASNFTFVGPGEIIILAQTKVYFVKVSEDTQGQNLDVTIPL